MIESFWSFPIRPVTPWVLPSGIGDRVRSIIGHGATEILRQAKVSGVFLTGGDTALGLLMNVGADGSEILSEIMVGIP